MERRLSGGSSNSVWDLYSFGMKLSDHQNHFQIEGALKLRNKHLSNFGKGVGEKYLHFNEVYRDSDISPIYDQDSLEFFTPKHIPGIDVDPEKATALRDVDIWGLPEGQGKDELNGVKNGPNISWSTKEPSAPEPNIQSTTRSIFCPHNEFLSTTPYREGYQDWTTETPYLLLDLDSAISTMTSAEIRTFTLGLSRRPDTGAPNNSPQETTEPPLDSPKPFSTAFIPGLAPSLFDSNTPNFTPAAHRAVADLFPELAHTCSLGAKTASHERTPQCKDIRMPKETMAVNVDSTTRPAPFLDLGEANVTKRSIKRKRSVHSNFGFSEKTLPLKSLAPSKLSRLEGGEIYEYGELGAIPHSQTALHTVLSPTTITTQPPKFGQLSQLSSDLVNLGLKDSNYSHPFNFNIEGDFSCPTVTISPRYLSKLQLPLISPKQNAFDFGEENYVSEVVAFEEGELAAEEYMPGILDIETEFDSSRPGDSGNSSSPLPAQSSVTTPPQDSLPLTTPASDTCSLSPTPAPTSPEVTRHSLSSPEGSPCYPRQKSRAKGTPRSKPIKSSSKELLKEQNQLLLRWRSQGISYKAIKERLGIDEAESTLRGRLRTLTKPKNERLRKPQWAEKDVLLLLEVVDPTLLNVKWKQVSEAIVSLGGSYKFGPSTCKKQYMKLVANGRARPLAECALGKRLKMTFEARNSCKA